jgi:hypothetical protein
MKKSYRDRKIGTRKERTTFLIICEGKVTERTYLSGYRERNSGLLIITPNSTVTDPENLVLFALSQISKYDIDFDGGDQVWCVFDADNNNDENIRKAKKLAEEKVHICFSNPCFELWYLLHFRYHDQAISTSDLKAKLEELIKNYDKTKDYFDLLLSKRDEAIKRTNRLNQKLISAGIELLSKKSNPSTQVVNLVQEMMKIIKENKRKQND